VDDAEKLARKALRHKAMDMLSRREHAIAELGQKLAGKGYDEDSVQDTVAQLAADGLVSDERFTEAFVRYRAARGYGPLHIQSELRERGVGQAVMETYLDARDSRWLQLCEEVRRKRFGEARPADFKERARQARFLQYRGFTSEQVRRALDGEEFE
jgi:regulatory protein